MYPTPPISHPIQPLLVCLSENLYERPGIQSAAGSELTDMYIHTVS